MYDMVKRTGASNKTVNLNEGDVQVASDERSIFLSRITYLKPGLLMYGYHMGGCRSLAEWDKQTNLQPDDPKCSCGLSLLIRGYP